MGYAEPVCASSNEFNPRGAAPLIDFENSYKNRTAGMTANPASYFLHDNRSMAEPRDSVNGSLSQNAPQTTHYIQANVQQSMNQIKPDSTLLDIDENSKLIAAAENQQA